MLRFPPVPAIQEVYRCPSMYFEYFYTFGDQTLVRSFCLSVMDLLRESAEKNAMTVHHPNYQLWVTFYNLLSFAERELVVEPKLEDGGV